MGQIRPLARDDLQTVADLLVRTFQRHQGVASPAMADYVGALFLELPDRQADIQPLIYEDDAGVVIGFMGMYAQQMQIGDKVLRAAIGHSLVVNPDAGDPTAGARLCRSFLQGPQDIAFSDRANTISTALWRGMGGLILPFYSLDWQRILRPAEAATFKVRRRLHLLGSTAPLLQAMDGLTARIARSRGRAVMEPPSFPSRPNGLSRSDVHIEELMKAIRVLVAEDVLYPVWSDAALRHQLEQAAQKRDLGPVVQQIVHDGSGRLVGAYIYHLKPHGFAHVLHVLTRRQLAGQVIDILLVDAYERGAFAIGGRAQHRLIEPLAERHASFSSTSRLVFSASDPEVTAAALAGQAVFGGLVGEAWPRFHGDGMR